MHRIHAILEDQKKSHDTHHERLKKVSLIIFAICTIFIAVAIWYAHVSLKELSENMVEINAKRFENQK